MSKAFISVLVIGVLIRLLFSFSTFHTDIRAFDLGGQIVSRGHIWDLYDYLATLDPKDPLVEVYKSDLFIYPPAIYLLHGIFSSVFSSFLPAPLLRQFLVDYSLTFGNILINLHLLFLKLPYLIFDIGCAFLLAKLFTEKKQQLQAFSLWMFNPVTIYASFMMGQFDVIPTFFVILSLVVLKKRWLFLRLEPLFVSAICLGVGAAFKIYPLFLLIPLASLTTGWKKRFLILLLGSLPYFLSVFPYLFSAGYRSSALVAGQILKSFYAVVPISAGESIILFMGAMIFLFLLFLIKNLPSSPSLVEMAWRRFFTILLIFFIFTHFHPQWFVWITPFLIIDLIESRFKHWLLVVGSLTSFIGMLFFFDPSLTVGLFSPIWSQLGQMPSIWQILGRSVDYNLARSLLQTGLVGCALYYIYGVLTKEKI